MSTFVLSPSKLSLVVQGLTFDWCLLGEEG